MPGLPRNLRFRGRNVYGADPAQCNSLSGYGTHSAAVLNEPDALRVMEYIVDMSLRRTRWAVDHAELGVVTLEELKMVLGYEPVECLDLLRRVDFTQGEEEIYPTKHAFEFVRTVSELETARRKSINPVPAPAEPMG